MHRHKDKCRMIAAGKRTLSYKASFKPFPSFIEYVCSTITAAEKEARK